MNVRERKTEGFKPILVSPGNHTRLAEMTKKSQIYNDIITELLNKNVNVFDAVGLQGNRIGAQTPVAPESTKELRPHG